MKKIHFLTLVVFIITTKLFSQSAWTNYNRNNSNIKGESVFSITIDSYGNKWMYCHYEGPSSGGGLTKFDGNQWINYRGKKNLIGEIKVDSKGVLWLGCGDDITWQSNFTKFDGTNWTYYDTKNSNISDNQINEIEIDSYGNKWIGTNNGLSKFDGITFTNFTTKNSKINGNIVSKVAIDKLDNKWIVTESGLSKFDGSSWMNYDSTNSTISTLEKITALESDMNGNIWIGTNTNNEKSDNYSFLHKFDGVKWTKNSLLKNIFISKINFDSKGIKWIGTNNGIYKFDDKIWVNYNSNNSGLSDNQIYDIAFDSYNNKWIGTRSFGLFKLTGDGISKLCNPIESIQEKSYISCKNSYKILSFSSNSSNYDFLWSGKGLNGNTIQLNNFKKNLIEISQSGNYKLVVKDSVCFYSDSLNISIHDSIINTPNICMVTNQNNHNLVVWENIDNNYVSKYRIYKQNQVTSKYELVHEQSKHEISQWLDSLSTSNTNIDRYKILILDSCGNETTLSNNHSTMLLSSNVGLNGTVNLSWNAYEGFDYQNFEIWRSSDGSNFIKIGTVANNSYAYIDNNPPVNAWYQIRISKQEVCNPSKRTINYVNSNIISKDGKSLEINEKDETLISVHPNPVHSQLTVNSTVNGVMKCQILNIEGKIMMEEVISTSHSKIDVQNLEQGIYFIRVNESNIKFFKN
jgi:hypothetical protein